MLFEIDRLLTLVDKTENNLRLIERFNGNFALPVLNEWRYSTRHILVANFKSDDAAAEANVRAMRHLQRAYFDSCDLLIDCLLTEIRTRKESYRGYEATVLAVFPEYSEVLAKVRRSSTEVDCILSDKEHAREEKYLLLEPVIKELEEVVAVFDDHEVAVNIAIKKAWFKFVWQILIGLSSMAALIVAILK